MKKILTSSVLAFLAMFVFVGSVSACSNVSTSKGNMTAKMVNTNLSTSLDASGCQIGAYFDQDGEVNKATITGASHYGIFVDSILNDVAVNVSDSHIYNIGDLPNFSGAQHGVGIYYNSYGTVHKALGTSSGNTVELYQKGGIVISGSGSDVSLFDNTVNGLDNVPFIAQNGIQFGYGASGEARGNTINGNWYTGADWTSTGLLLFDVYANQVKTSNNKFENNQTNRAVVTVQSCPHMYGGVYEGWGLCLVP